MSPTYDALQKLASGFRLDITELFVAESKQPPSGRRALTRDQGGRPHPTPTYRHELLCHDMANKRMLPFKSCITARAFSDFEDWSRHKGEEFIYVLAGEIEVFTECYETVRLAAGDSIYFDSEMGHGCISISEDDAQVLWVSAA
jgi:mannose-6-phosphate isomerase-like protein (cupin superfamily)